jgi:hypothetical protein
MSYLDGIDHPKDQYVLFTPLRIPTAVFKHLTPSITVKNIRMPGYKVTTLSHPNKARLDIVSNLLKDLKIPHVTAIGTEIGMDLWVSKGEGHSEFIRDYTAKYNKGELYEKP